MVMCHYLTLPSHDVTQPCSRSQTHPVTFWTVHRRRPAASWKPLTFTSCQEEEKFCFYLCLYCPIKACAHARHGHGGDKKRFEGVCLLLKKEDKRKQHRELKRLLIRILKRYAGISDRVMSSDFMSEWRRDITQERKDFEFPSI